MNVINAYREVGTYRGAAQMCGTTPKIVKRAVEKDAVAAARASQPANYEIVRELVADKVDKTHARITAKRLLPAAVAAGYRGSARNFRRLVSAEKKAWRRVKAVERQRRPAVWTPGEYLVIDWGVLGGLHVFCAVLAYSRFWNR